MIKAPFDLGLRIAERKLAVARLADEIRRDKMREALDAGMFPHAGVIHGMLFSPEGDLLVESLQGNLVTQTGNQWIAERAANITTPPNYPSGMGLGTGSTAAATTGGGAALGTFVSGSNAAFDGGFPTSGAGSGTSRRITYQSSWAAGIATSPSPPLAEAVIRNSSPLGTGAGTAADTVARGLLSPTVPKAAADTFALSWTIDFGA